MNSENVTRDELDVPDKVEQHHVDAAVEIAQGYSPGSARCQLDVIAEIAKNQAGVEERLFSTVPRWHSGG